MSTCKHRGRKAYYLIAFEGQPLSNGVVALFDIDVVSNVEQMNATTERINAKYGLAMRKWSAVVPVDSVHSHALRLNDEDKARSLALLDRIYQTVRAGHYNTEIRDRLSKFIELEYRTIDDEKHSTMQSIRTLPDRAFTGPIEAWARGALGSFSCQRMSQCNERDGIVRSIIASATPAPQRDTGSETP